MELKYKRAFSFIPEDKPNPISLDSKPQETKQPEQESVSVTKGFMDFANIGNGEGKISIDLTGSVDPSPAPAKRKRKSNTPSPDDAITTGSHEDDGPEPYEEKYKETTAMLKGAIAQLDMNLADMQQDVHQIRNSRTMKGKYTYLSNIQANIGQSINTKITAIREINSTISKCNDLELKRAKELHLAEAEANSDKTVMDMYNAFISMPTQTAAPGGVPVTGLGPSVAQLNMGNGIPLPAEVSEEVGMQNFINSMNPSQRLNMYENDPNVQQVVVYNHETGARYFEVMNIATGEVIPNVDKRDMMFMEDTVIDWETKTARNLNLNETYPLVEVGINVGDSY